MSRGASDYGHAQQGVNPGARHLQAWLDAAAALGPDAGAACPYPRHRASDWSTTGSTHVVCGVCHPPARGLDGVVWLRDRHEEPSS